MFGLPVVKLWLGTPVWVGWSSCVIVNLSGVSGGGKGWGGGGRGGELACMAYGELSAWSPCVVGKR